jgi:hypothetical protein
MKELRVLARESRFETEDLENVEYGRPGFTIAELDQYCSDDLASHQSFNLIVN